MAVTLQIVKLPPSVLLACTESESELEELISFKLTRSEDEIDLGWAPEGMEKYFTHSKQSNEATEALKLILNGSGVVNKLCPDHAGGYSVFSDIKMLSSKEVEVAANALLKIDWNSLKTCIPQNREDPGRYFNTDLACHPNEFYLALMKKLYQFIQEANTQKFVIALWWD